MDKEIALEQSFNYYDAIVNSNISRVNRDLESIKNFVNCNNKLNSYIFSIQLNFLINRI